MMLLLVKQVCAASTGSMIQALQIGLPSILSQAAYSQTCNASRQNVVNLLVGHGGIGHSSLTHSLTQCRITLLVSGSCV